MASPSSSSASLKSSRRPRPRSPPSMYVAYETPTSKPPRPLIKLEKKSKNKPAESQPESYPNPFPTRSATVPAPEPHRRPSVSSLLSLRRKTATAPPSPSIPAQFAGPSTPGPSRRAPIPRVDNLHQPNVHPVDDIEPISRRPDKATRLLGNALPLQPSEIHTFPDQDGILFSEFSGTFRISPRSSSTSDAGSSFDDSASAESFDDECVADNSHVQRESTLLTPMEFRPPSVVIFAPLSGPDTASEADECPTEDEPITPVGPLHSRRRDEPPAQQHRGDSYYGFVHDHYMNPRPPSTPPVEYRPDTPFMDTVVAVNSQVRVARGGHVREPSVIRTEPKEGWMGEWNQGDMQDVISKLRSL
ncbi:hypothetical protein DFH09DRAFT_1149075, partial [Mycena vulgaris]